MDRQSSLPSSLIPHLYTAPQQPRDSSTRTTLLDTTDHPVSPVFTHLYPNQSRNTNPVQWSEGEPGPSSLARNDSYTDPYDYYAERNQHPDRFYTPEGHYMERDRYSGREHYSDRAYYPERDQHASREPYREVHTERLPYTEREPYTERLPWTERQPLTERLLYTEREPYTERISYAERRPYLEREPYIDRQQQQQQQPQQQQSQQQQYSERRPPSARLPERDFVERTDQYWPSAVPYNINQHPSYQFESLPPAQQQFTMLPQEDASMFNRHDAYTYAPVGSLSLSAPTSAYLRSPNFNSSAYRESSIPRSVDTDPETAPGGLHEGKRRRAESLSADEGARKSRNIKKTAVACNFCRGRKLRCNGAKPSCWNCTVRKFQCEYVSNQRRRGPGKAPKGTRSRRAMSTSRNVAHRPPSSVPEHELDALAPEVRPYTSVMALDNFAFQPPDVSPQYMTTPSPPQPDPRDDHSGPYTSRKRETDSEDRSDAEDMYRSLG